MINKHHLNWLILILMIVVMTNAVAETLSLQDKAVLMANQSFRELYPGISDDDLAKVQIRVDTE